MNKTNNNNITFSPFGGVEGGSINNSLSKGEGRGEAFYVAPTIEVIKNIYGGGLMDDFLSTNIGSGGGTPPPSGAKPDNDWTNNTWGNVWSETEANNDAWGM